jgi:hypothetical protein
LIYLSIASLKRFGTVCTYFSLHFGTQWILPLAPPGAAQLVSILRSKEERKTIGTGPGQGEDNRYKIEDENKRRYEKKRKQNEKQKQQDSW